MNAPSASHEDSRPSFDRPADSLVAVTNALPLLLFIEVRVRRHMRRPTAQEYH